METLVDYWYGKNRDRNLDLQKAKLEVPIQQISPTTKSQQQFENKPKGKVNKMKKHKQIEEWLTTVTESWAEYAKEETFSGMNLAQFKVLTGTSITEREQLDTILRDRRAGIARREAADRKQGSTSSWLFMPFWRIRITGRTLPCIVRWVISRTTNAPAG